jgi:hypothetical protein
VKKAAAKPAKKSLSAPKTSVKKEATPAKGKASTKSPAKPSAAKKSAPKTAPKAAAEVKQADVAP